MKKILQKYIAESGLCSRRRAEEMIRSGLVLVNGQKAEPGMRVDEGDEVKINNKIIKPSNDRIYIIMNKPAGYTCTNRKFKDEKNVFELLSSRTLPALTGTSPKGRGLVAGLKIAGRLDKDSRGLILLTNDGDLVNKITHPRYGHAKKYIVKISNSQFVISGQFLKDLIYNFKKGVDIGDGEAGRAKSVKYLGDDKFEIILGEGKKRQIRRMFEALGLKVKDLQRTAIGNIKLGKLKTGELKELSPDEAKEI